MSRILLLAAACALASCKQQPTQKQEAAVEPASATGQAASAAPRLVEEKNDTLEFSYSWPAEAAAIPNLNKQLEEELGRDRVEAVAAAREDKAGRAQDGTDFFAHSYSKEWRLTGNSPSLLSLIGEVSTFTGGPHPNTDYDGILWDKSAGRLVAAADLFGDGKALDALGSRYCKGLDAARLEKRGEALPPSPDDFMTACPPLAEQTFVAADSNGNGRFDMLQIWLPPSVAGAYPEGSYQVDLKMDAATLNALKPEYRASFETA